MNNFLYVTAVTLLTLWMIGFFIYTLGAVVHILLLLALVMIAFRAKREDRVAR